MDAKTVGPDEVQIECGKLAREANREFRELDSEIKSLETALAQEREKRLEAESKVMGLRMFVRLFLASPEQHWTLIQRAKAVLAETAPDARSEKEADHD